MQAFRRILNRAVDDGAMVAAEVAIVLMMAHITAGLLSRWIFRQGLESVPDFVAFYYMTSVAFLSLAYVMRSDGHLAAEFFNEQMKPRQEFKAGETATVLEGAKKRAVKTADEIVNANLDKLKKWEKIVDEVGRDPQKIADEMRKHVFDKVRF